MSDISPLAGLHNLALLNISQTPVSNMAPLSNLVSLADSAVSNTNNGLHWRATHVADPALKTLAKQRNPDRTVLALNYLREAQGLPAYWPENYSGSRDIPPQLAAESALEEIAKIDPATIPPQSNLGFQFEIRPGGIIFKAEDPRLIINIRQETMYIEIRRKNKQLLHLCEPRTNALSALSEELELFGRALKGKLEDVGIFEFWSRANALRRQRDGDLRARNSDDPDTPPLPENVSAGLADLVDTINVFSTGDPSLQGLDRQAAGPHGRGKIAGELGAGRQIIMRAVALPDMVNKEASDILAHTMETARAASTTPGANADQALLFSGETERNFAITILRKVLDEAKGGLKMIKEGAWRGVGAAIATGTGATMLVSSMSETFKVILGRLMASDVVREIIFLISRL